MSALSSLAVSPLPDKQFRQYSQGTHLEVLTDIYQENTNIAIWQRSLTDRLIQAADKILETQPNLEESMLIGPQNAFEQAYRVLGKSDYAELLAKDIAKLVAIFCGLFDLKHAALRITALDRAMCPRFHVDRVPCRMITTYQGVATEWLPQHLADRSKLGTGNRGKPDELSGLFECTSDVRQMSFGDVALLKGELWENNEGAGLIHRSPQLIGNTRRLLLTIDFIND